MQRTNDKTALQEYVKENEDVFSKLEEDTYDLLTVMAGIRAMKFIKRDVENVGGRFDMCKAFDDMMRDSRKEGYMKCENLMERLNQALIASKRIDDLVHASTDRDYRQKLMLELGIV